MTKLITAYQCDAQGVLVGATQVQEDPHMPGDYLLPPGVTLIAPPEYDPCSGVAVFEKGAWTVHPLSPISDPEPDPTPAAPALPTADNKPAVQANQIAAIVDGQWKVLADFRGTTYWLADGSQRVITDIGETLPLDALMSRPPSP